MTIAFTKAEVEAAIRGIYYDRTDIVISDNMPIRYIRNGRYEPDSEICEGFDYVEMDLG